MMEIELYIAADKGDKPCTIEVFKPGQNLVASKGKTAQNRTHCFQKIWTFNFRTHSFGQISDQNLGPFAETKLT